MDYEKKYNEALERARKIHDEIVNNEVLGFPGQITDIFPELRESEDERIRKAIVATIEQCPYDFLNPKNRDKMLAYLEKQKEQKPKFYPGDVIKCTSTGSLWVRCKGRDNIRSDGHTACIGGGYELASEEEAVQFFQELNENGYRWDCIKGRPMKKEQKPVQSEEEKEYIRTLKSRIADFLRGKDKDEVDITYYQRICDWLDGRHVEQKPSEEQMDVDLEKEIIRYQREDMDRDTTVGDVARHFYELGLKAREKNK